MKAKLVLSMLKLQVFVAVILRLLLFQVNLYAVGQPSLINGTESQNVSTSQQPDPSHPPFLKGIVLTAAIVVGILGGLTCLIICVAAIVVISVQIHKQRKPNRSRRVTSSIHTAAVNAQSFDMTSNTAYRCGQQVRTNNMNEYSIRPSSRTSTAQNNHSEALVLPSRYVQTPNNRMDISVDSLGYVRLPKPHD